MKECQFLSEATPHVLAFLLTIVVYVSQKPGTLFDYRFKKAASRARLLES
jgi:hypothetical protein